MDLVRARTIEEYHESPESQKYRFGFWYVRPFAMEIDACDDFDAVIKSRHPIQYFFRETLATSARRTMSRLKDAWYSVKRFFVPCHADIRREIPREWCDLSEIIDRVGFAIIKSFRKEMIEGWVDWSATKDHAEFERWIISAVQYIDNDRPALASLPDAKQPSGEFFFSQEKREAQGNAKEWDEWLILHRKVEQEIHDRDTQLLTEMIKFRKFFWT